MKLLKSITTLALVLAAGLAQSAEISLEKAENRIGSRYGMSWQDLSVSAIVENLAYDKKVQLHYQQRDGQWVSKDMHFDGSLDGYHEKWTVSWQEGVHTPYIQQEAMNLQFVLRYEVNGQVYWDNNHGQNYFVAAATGEYINVPVLAKRAYAQAPYSYAYGDNRGIVEGTFNVTTLVQNLGYEKDVEIHYSYDNWQTTHIAKAQFAPGLMMGYAWVTYPNANNVEAWTFVTRGDEAQNTLADTIQYAVKYTVNGQTYWDNNYGANHIVEINKR